MLKYMTGIPETDLTKLLSTNAIECYELDEVALGKIAERVGPEKRLFVTPAAEE